MGRLTDQTGRWDLGALAEPVRERFRDRHDARERSLALSRDVVRAAANAIRAVHRGDFALADELLDKAGALLTEAATAAEPHPAVYYSGFLQDGAKEYAEAVITRSAVAGEPIPGPDAVGFDDASWLLGLAETVGELRRACLDRIRAGDLGEAEPLLDLMQEILSVLVTIDVPEAHTRGLRRATDAARAITERTRGDLTAAVGQRDLRRAMDAHRHALEAVLDQDSG